jgi:TolB-like protein/Tfp pilus assembly protein PilF
MDQRGSTDVFLFEGFRFDRGDRELFRLDAAGNGSAVSIGSRVLDLLGLLVERPGKLVSKREIIDTVWCGSAIEEANLTVQISALRRVLDRGHAQNSCIQTVPGRGYRFVTPVTRVDADAHSAMQTIARGDEHSRPRLSIVVLPFTNLSDDREQQYFADGMTEDLTTDLSRMSGMFVISRNTAFTYRNKAVDTKQTGRELGVHYVLEGSVRRSGNQVRVSAQLIDAEIDAHLWAERFDRETVDLFTLQNEITSRIANALGVELIAAEAARPTEHPDALDYIIRGRSALLKPQTRDTYAEAISLFEHALVLDPQSVEAQSRLAGSLVSRMGTGTTYSAAADLARAEGLVGQALAASPRSAYAHLVKGFVLRAQCRWEEAVLEYETALASNRNMVGALNELGWCKLFIGSIDEVIPLVERAIRLSPRDPGIGYRYLLIGIVHLLQSRTDEAVVWLEKSAQRQSGSTVRSRPSRLCLWPQRRNRTRHRRTRRSPQIKRRRSFFKHRPPEGGQAAGSAEDPRLVRSHLFRRAAQSRHARGVNPDLFHRTAPACQTRHRYRRADEPLTAFDRSVALARTNWRH